MRLIEFSKMNQAINRFSSKPHTSWVTHNRFSDWTQAERDFLLGYHQNYREFRRQGYYPSSIPLKPINWVEKGAVSPVQNQHICGSDWAFAAIGLVEANHFFETGNLHDLSEQQLIDCTQIYGNKGCLGGAIDGALRYAQDHGVMLERDYPYKGLTREGCMANWGMDTVRIADYVDVPSMNPEQLARAVQKGPVAVAIQGDSMVYMQYAGGIITDESCFESKEVNHSVLVVGYGQENGMEYFLVKNSWGETWGDKGFVKIGLQTAEGICGIQTAPVQGDHALNQGGQNPQPQEPHHQQPQPLEAHHLQQPQYQPQQAAQKP